LPHVPDEAWLTRVQFMRQFPFLDRYNLARRQDVPFAVDDFRCRPPPLRALHAHILLTRSLARSCQPACVASLGSRCLSHASRRACRPTRCPRQLSSTAIRRRASCRSTSLYGHTPLISSACTHHRGFVRTTIVRCARLCVPWQHELQGCSISAMPDNAIRPCVVDQLTHRYLLPFSRPTVARCAPLCLPHLPDVGFMHTQGTSGRERRDDLHFFHASQEWLGVHDHAALADIL
jgi:hypothetical protein